jgi:hypothetical protein
VRLRTKLEIVCACVVVPCALELFSAKRSFAWLSRIRANGESVAPGLLAFLLKRGGHDASVVIGVRRSGEGALEAHAWLACDGTDPYLEPSDSIATFIPLSRA